MKCSTSSKLKIWTILLSIGICLLSWTYFLSYQGGFNNNLFWMSIIIIGYSIFSIEINGDISEKYKIVYLFIFGTIIYILSILPSSIHFHFYDELATYETTKLIYENGNLNFTVHFDLPKYYPGLGLLTVILKTMINMDIFINARILIGIIHSFLLVFLYLFLKGVSLSDKVSSIGTFIYATNPVYVYFHSMFSYESLGIFLGISIAYLVLKTSFSIFKKKNQENTFSYTIVLIILIATLTITHHLSSLMILLLMILIAISYKNKIEYRFHTNTVFLTTILIFAWMTYLAKATVSYLYGHFINRFMRIFELSLFGGSKTNISSASLEAAKLPSYELIIDNPIYPILLILLSIIGAVIVIKKYKNPYSYILIIYGPILYIVSLGFVLTSGQELAIRTWGFLYIGLSLMISISINKLKKFQYKRNILMGKLANMSAFPVILLIAMGGISIGDKPIHRIPDDLLHPKVLGESGSMTTDVFYSAEWFENHLGRFNNISIDYGGSSIFAYYGSQNPYSGISYKIFFPEKIDKQISNFINYYKINYIIVDRRMTRYLAETGAYFGKERKSKEYLLIGYGSKQPLSNKSIEKFDSSEIFYNTYDNGNIAIYNFVS